VVGTEDTVQGYLAHQMFHLHQLELENQAQHERLVRRAVRGRLRNRKAVREAQALRLASDAVGCPEAVPSEARAAVRTAR
jgi:hypothetical protein